MRFGITAKKGWRKHLPKIADAIRPTHSICGRWLVASDRDVEDWPVCLLCLHGEQIPARSQKDRKATGG